MLFYDTMLLTGDSTYTCLHEKICRYMTKRFKKRYVQTKACR